MAGELHSFSYSSTLLMSFTMYSTEASPMLCTVAVLSWDRRGVSQIFMLQLCEIMHWFFSFYVYIAYNDQTTLVAHAKV